MANKSVMAFGLNSKSDVQRTPCGGINSINLSKDGLPSRSAVFLAVAIDFVKSKISCLRCFVFGSMYFERFHRVRPMPRYVWFLVLAIFCPTPLHAEKAPSSIEELRLEATAIVIGTIHDIRIESEPSEFETGGGNKDWGIYLTLIIESAEKGAISPGQLIETRCFRIQYRTSMLEYLTPSGHSPIPSIGTHVRAYLAKNEMGWSVLLPNGIEVLSGKSDDAPEIAALNSRAYTYWLPIEAWFLLTVVIAASSVVSIILRRVRNRHSAEENRIEPQIPGEQSDSAD